MTTDQIRRTKIVATLGPGSDAPGMVKQLLANGVDVVRLNLSHGEADDHRARAQAVRAAAAELGREVGILADLQGPKIRVRRFADGAVMLQDGAPFVLDCSEKSAPGDVHGVGVSYQDLPHDVQAGDMLLLDDGMIAMRVQRVEDKKVHCEVVNGGRLSDRKGL
ncbi:MAG: pyruvate kinase, partial [Xanthomonadales bacterium]|nr:pyruvate kinase [Xanthomonadales bacterium]